MQACGCQGGPEDPRALCEQGGGRADGTARVSRPPSLLREPLSPDMWARGSEGAAGGNGGGGGSAISCPRPGRRAVREPLGEGPPEASQWRGLGAEYSHPMGTAEGRREEQKVGGHVQHQEGEEGTEERC